MVAFLKDPTGAPLWEENPEAKDIVHVETEKVSTEITPCLTTRCICMVMFLLARYGHSSVQNGNGLRWQTWVKMGVFEILFNVFSNSVAENQLLLFERIFLKSYKWLTICKYLFPNTFILNTPRTNRTKFKCMEYLSICIFKFMAAFQLYFQIHSDFQVLVFSKYLLLNIF